MIFSFKKKINKETKEQSKMVMSTPTVTSHSLSNKYNRNVKDKKSKKILHKLGKISASSGAKYGLIIGDEGSILIYMVGKAVKSRNFIAHASTDNLKEFETILSRDKAAPVFVIIDSMDQSFIQQSLPPISALGIKKLIKRRLDRDLGADIIKGYVLLERDTTGRRDWNFLMVSLENSPYLKLWFDFIEKIDNRLQGIYLLSVEVENIVRNLDLAMGIAKSNKKNTDVSPWKFFVTHNKVGGFRQVILKNGRIIFTRLTQAVGDTTTAVIAGNIEQEMSSTIEYMKRLSFNYQQGLDVYIVASDEINNSLDISQIPSKNVYKFTPFEVAEFLGITGAAQQSDQFGDVILTACIVSNRTHRLVLSLPKALKVNQLYNIIKYQRVAAVVISLILLVYVGMVGMDVLAKYSRIEDLKQKKVAQQRRFDDFSAEIKNSGIDVIKISDDVALYNQIKSETKSPLPVLSQIRSAIDSSIIIHEVTWENGSITVAGIPPSAELKEKGETVSLVLYFPETTNTNEAFTIIAKKVLGEVRTAFPDYKVVYTKLPDIFSKRTDVGEIDFKEDKNAVGKNDKSNLEATLVLTKSVLSSIPVVVTESPVPVLINK